MLDKNELATHFLNFRRIAVKRAVMYNEKRGTRWLLVVFTLSYDLLNLMPDLAVVGLQVEVCEVAEGDDGGRLVAHLQVPHQLLYL